MFQREAVVEAEELAPIELDERYKKPPMGKEILGRSLDSIERR